MATPKYIVLLLQILVCCPLFGQTSGGKSAVFHNTFQDTSSSAISGVTLQSAVYYNPILLSEQAMAVSDWNYAIAGSAKVQIGIPAQIGFQHNSNQVNARLSDQLYFSLDHRQILKNYADKILNELGVDSLAASQLQLLQTLQNQEKRITSSLSDVKRKGIYTDDERKSSLQQQVNPSSHASNVPLSENNLPANGTASPTSKLQSPIQRYAATLEEEIQRLQQEIIVLKSQIDLPQKTIENLLASKCANDIVSLYGEEYLSAREKIMSSVEQLQLGRFTVL